MRDVKNLAAEIEAVTTEVLAEAIRRQVVLLRFNEANTLDQFFDADEIQLLCTRAANAVKDHVTGQMRVEPALQSRAFEDGAQWMREGALNRISDRAYLMEHDSEQRAVLRAKGDVEALPLQPEGERSDA
ncbi:hypothetical protein [Methylorubrum extorquens]